MNQIVYLELRLFYFNLFAIMAGYLANNCMKLLFVKKETVY